MSGHELFAYMVLDLKNYVDDAKFSDNPAIFEIGRKKNDSKMNEVVADVTDSSI